MTTLKLNLTPELEQQLLQEADRQGLEPEKYALKLLQQQLQPSFTITPSPSESELLQQINLGLSSKIWEQYEALIDKRQSETLTPEEHTILIAISNQIEKANARRIQALIALANLRKTSLEIVMSDLGIEVPSYV